MSIMHMSGDGLHSRKEYWKWIMKMKQYITVNRDIRDTEGKRQLPLSDVAYSILVNPASKSGNGKHIWQEVKQILEENKIKYQVYFTKKSGDGTRYAKELTGENEDVLLKLIVLGGDGTMNEVVQGICDFEKVEIIYIPTGSSNDLSRSLGNKMSTKERVSAMLESHRIQETDIGTATLINEKGETVLRKRFIVSSGIGFDAAVCEEAFRSRIKKTLNKFGLGKLTYLGIALKHLLALRAVPCEILVDDSEILPVKRIMFVACMNHPYEGGGFKFCPDADYGDGLLDLCILGNMPKWKMLFALPAALKGKHTGFREVYLKRAKKVSVTLKEPLFVHTDGEVPGKTAKIVWELSGKKMKLQI